MNTITPGSVVLVGRDIPPFIVQQTRTRLGRQLLAVVDEFGEGFSQ